jgi:hypothetical protein
MQRTPRRGEHGTSKWLNGAAATLRGSPSQHVVTSPRLGLRGPVHGFLGACAAFVAPARWAIERSLQQGLEHQ